MPSDDSRKKAVNKLEKAVRKAVKRGVPQGDIIQAVELASSEAVKKTVRESDQS
jgi:hypothetical protein